jgi:hypothetical protein
LLPQEFRTAGVDLAAQNTRTALAEISWSASVAVLESVRATTGRWPLSVSAGRIAYPAMRCAGVLARIAATGRAGSP